MDVTAALKDIEDLLLEAGKLAVQTQKSAKVSYKEAEQIVTETDLAISKLAQERLKHWFDQPDHILLDEESITNVGIPADVFAQSTYQWAFDPIDGTSGYAAGRNLWGISMGILKHGMPVAGIIYLPAIREMLVADATKAWHIRNVGTPDEMTADIHEVIKPIDAQIFIKDHAGQKLGRDDIINVNGFSMKKPESALHGFHAALTGQVYGAILSAKFSIWDVAASVVIARRVGYQIRLLEEDRILDSFAISDFKDNWKMKNNWLLCAEKNFPALKAAITGKSG
ncbi:MAG TPA: inositol monophosphatase family protein [Alphaproteobacteria bacterium]